MTGAGAGVGTRTRTGMSTRAGIGARMVATTVKRIESRMEGSKILGSYEVVMEVGRKTLGGGDANE